MKTLKILAGTALISCIFAISAFAGNINSNEQSVVSVIHGQFEQEGRIFKVRQDYVDSALNYLAQDDVDLTAEEVQSVIAEIYANVKDGVESGYLTEVPAPSEAGADEAPPEQEQDQENGEQAPSSLPEHGEETATPSQVPETEPSQARQTDVHDKQTSQVTSMLELIEKAPGQSYEYISKDTDSYMDNILIPYEHIWLLIATISGLTAVIWIIILWERFSSHRQSRTLRRVLRSTLGCLLMMTAASLELAAGAWLGAFNEGAVLNSINTTGYYRTVYEELRRDTSQSLGLLGIPEEVMEEAITYERVVLAARQQVENNLKQGKYQAKTSILTDQLRDNIKSFLDQKSVTLTPKAENGLNLLIKRLDHKYAALLQWPFSSWWVRFDQQFGQMKRAGIWIMTGMLVLQMTGIILLNRYRHRGIKACGMFLIPGSLAAAALPGTALLNGNLGPWQMTPEYMSQFFNEYGVGIAKTMIQVSGIGVLIGIGFIFIAMSWKEGRR